MKTTLLLCAWALAVGTAFAQAGPRAKDAPLDISYLRDHAETRAFMLGRPVKARPTSDGQAVLFLRAQARVPKLRLYEFDVASGRTRELLTPEQVLQGAEELLSPEEKARRERQRISVGGFTDYQLSEDGRQILVSLSGKLYLVQRATAAVRELKTGGGTLLDPKFSPDGKKVAYVLNHDLYVLDLASQRERRLTQGGSERLTHSLAEFVAQEEMGRFSGYWWSPDSRFLAYEEADATGVEVWYVADPARPEQPAHVSFYPRPGRANVKVRVGVLPVEGGNTVWLRWDAGRHPYLAQVRWDKHGPLTLTVQTRLQNEVVLLRADPVNGQTTPLLTERDDAWVNLHQDVPRWLPDNGGFLWISEAKDGPRLERRDPDGGSPEVLVPAAEGLLELLHVNGREGSAVVQLNGGRPTQAHLARVDLKSGRREVLTTAPGIHSAAFVPSNGGLSVRTTTTAAALPKATVHRADGALVGELPSVAESPGFVPRVELVRLDGVEGWDAAVVRPHNFQAGLRYPVLLNVYGGPRHQTVLASMRLWLLNQWLADQGFVVVAVDNRGTPGRGRAWERAIFKKFGSVPVEDQVAGLQALGKRYPELDLTRVGIYGWSFGGYTSALALLRRPDVFQAAVAGAPVVDWQDYDTHYTERYLGLPDGDAAAYREASLLTYAAELRRPLLLVHGTSDDNVYFRHSLRLADALFRAGKDFELLPLSGLTHMVPDPVVTQRLWSRIAEHFRRHLGRPGE